MQYLYYLSCAEMKKSVHEAKNIVEWVKWVSNCRVNKGGTKPKRGRKLEEKNDLHAKQSNKRK